MTHMTGSNRTDSGLETEEKQGPRLLDVMQHCRRVAFYLFNILIAVWTIGRLLEGLSGQAIFDPWLIKVIGASSVIMVLTALLAWLTQSAASIVRDRRQPRIYPAWLLLLIMALGGAFLLQGYAVAVSGLFAMLTGAVRDAELAAFALIKSHPATPIMVLNLILLKLFHSGFDVGLMAPFAWKLSFLLGFFIWSIVFGSLLLFLQGIKNTKIIHLVLAIAGTLIAMHLKSHADNLSTGIVFLHAAGVSMMIFQLLLTYASLRVVLPADALSLKHLPRGLALGFAVVLMIPVMTDLYRQNVDIGKSPRLAHSISMATGQGVCKVIRMTPDSELSGLFCRDTIRGNDRIEPKSLSRKKNIDRHVSTLAGEFKPDTWLPLYLRC